MKYLGSSLYHAFSDLGLAANADGMVARDLLYQLIFGHSFGVMVDMEALFSESCDGFLTDVFQDQELQVLILYRMERFRVTNKIAKIERSATVVSVVEGSTGAQGRGGRSYDEIRVESRD